MSLPSPRVPILRGPLRGHWWSPLSGGQFGRVGGGTCEPDLTRLFTERVGSGAVVFDLGAHIGYYMVLAAVLVKGRGRVLAFEPNPRNLRHLRRHVSMNRCERVEIVPSAVSEREGTASFARGSGSGTGRLATEGALRVSTTSVDGVVARPTSR